MILSGRPARKHQQAQGDIRNEVINMENTNYQAQGPQLSRNGNDKAVVDALAMEILKKGIMATAFGTIWPVAFMGIVFAQQTYKKVNEFKAMEGEVYNCAKIGWILARVGKYFGIGLTVFFVIWATMMLLSLLGAGISGIAMMNR